MEKGRCKKMSLNKLSIEERLVRISPKLRTRVFVSSNPQYEKETSFCIYHRASMTVEAAVVIPLIMGFFVSILFFFRVLFVQAAVEEALVYAGRMVAVESCLTDTEEALFLSADILVKSKLLEEENIENYVLGGTMGISLLESEWHGKEILLSATYIVKYPIVFWKQDGLWLTSENAFVKWKGDLYTGTQQGEWVYITETGSVYHKDTSCRSLDLNIQEGLLKDVSLYRGVDGQKYAPCERCMEETHPNQRVYFTDYGKLYHGRLSCSALKRTISKILLSQVGERRACSFCYTSIVK